MEMVEERHDSNVQHAVIIAAGAGVRFRESTQSLPKPLLTVAGISLIARTIYTAKKAGIRYFTVVTGYEAQTLEAYLRQPVFPGVHIQCIRNEKWQRANGLSVLKARGKVQGQFVLLMADHLFEADIVKRLLANPLPDGYCRLAVDFNLQNILDLDDATRVHVANGRILTIGKNIESYNAIDTGIFFCSHALFEALDTAISKGKESLSAGIQELAQDQRMEAVDIGDLFWQDIDNERDRKEGERRLLQTLVNETDSWLTRKINRKISLTLTRHLARTRIGPNHITFFSFSLGLMGAGCMLWGTYFGFLMGSALFLASSILDGCDGEIARLKFQETHLGAWLDVITDNLTHFALFSCMSIGLIVGSGSTLYALPGALLVAGSVASFFMAVVAQKQLRKDHGLIFSGSRLADIQDGSGRYPQNHLSIWLDRFANRDFAYLLLILSCINRTGWFLWIAGMGAPMFALLFYRTLTYGGTNRTMP